MKRLRQLAGFVESILLSCPTPARRGVSPLMKPVVVFERADSLPPTIASQSEGEKPAVSGPGAISSIPISSI